MDFKGAKLTGVVMGHAPGHMIMLDVKDHEVFGTGVRWMMQ